MHLQNSIGHLYSKLNIKLRKEALGVFLKLWLSYSLQQTFFPNRFAAFLKQR